jgi:hypothetical protein
LSKRRPGRLWLFFYGRKRRGFPGLLVSLLAAALLLGLLYGLPGGADLSRWFIVATVGALVALLLGSLALVAVAVVRGPGRHPARPGRRRPGPNGGRDGRDDRPESAEQPERRPGRR